MLNLETICNSKSPFALLIVIERKKDGAYCICVDYTTLNKVVVADPVLVTMAKNYFQ